MIRLHFLVVFAVALLAAGMSRVSAAELLMFETPGCPYCAAWHRDVGPGYAQSSEGQRAPLRIVQISRSADVGVVLASPVRAAPTFVLVDNGREVSRITGYPGADFFWGLLGQMIEKLDQPRERLPGQNRADTDAQQRRAARVSATQFAAGLRPSQ